jgi:hypothetical protein
LGGSERNLSEQSITEALGLGNAPTNQEVINALYNHYNRNYSKMYKSAERDFGIKVDALVAASEKPFISTDLKHGRLVTRSDVAPQETVRETALEKFLRNRGLDGWSTNQDLINKLYERYGPNDATTYARARYELGIDIEKLSKNRKGRIDGLVADASAARGKSEQSNRNADGPASSTKSRSTRDRAASDEAMQGRPGAGDGHRPDLKERVEPSKMAPQSERIDDGPSRQSGIQLGRLISNYPRSPLDASHADSDYNGPFLREQFKLAKWIDNSCAIRLNYALRKSGVDIGTGGALTETIHPVSTDGTTEAPFAATLRAKELFAKIDKHLGGAEKTKFDFGPDDRPDLSGLNGIVLYEYQDLSTGRQTRHIGILQDGKEQTLVDPTGERARGRATVLRIDSDYDKLASL